MRTYLYPQIDILCRWVRLLWHTLVRHHLECLLSRNSISKRTKFIRIHEWGALDIHVIEEKTCTVCCDVKGGILKQTDNMACHSRENLSVCESECVRANARSPYWNIARSAWSRWRLQQSMNLSSRALSTLGVARKNVLYTSSGNICPLSEGCFAYLLSRWMAVRLALNSLHRIK